MSVLWILFLVPVVVPATGKSTSGDLLSQKGWVYLEMFNFASGEVNFQYTVSYPRIYAPVRLLFYTLDQFLLANDSAKSCDQRLSYLSSWLDSSQVLELDTTRQSSGCYNRYLAGEGDTVQCSGRFHIKTDIMGPWFVVANRCGSQNGVEGLSMRYYIDNIVDKVVQPLWPLLSGQGSVSHPGPLLTMLSTLLMLLAALVICS